MSAPRLTPHQVVNGARRCDHDPRAPRLEPATELPARAPKIVGDVDERLTHLYHRTNRFPELTGRALAGPWSRLRGRRSSRREAWTLVARALGRRWDRRTNRAGAPRGDARDSADCPSIADLVDETKLSRGRVVRALRDLRVAGYIRSHRVCMAYNDGNAYCGLPSVRELLPLFFQRLGIKDGKRKRNQRHARAKWDAVHGRAASPIGLQKGRDAVRAAIRGARAYQAEPPPAAAPRLEGGEARLERLRRALGVPPDTGQ